MTETIVPIIIAAAGGLGYLSLKHQTQFNELAKIIYGLGIIIFFGSMIIDLTIDIVLLELKYEIPTEKRDEAISKPEEWQSFWSKTTMFTAIALVYVFIIHLIGDSVQSEQNAKLDSQQKSEDNQEVSESS